VTEKIKAYQQTGGSNGQIVMLKKDAETYGEAPGVQERGLLRGNLGTLFLHPPGKSIKGSNKRGQI